MQTYRTVLEQKIRERRQTFEEFAADIELFAREHKEPGTLGVRHLQRLIAGRQRDGSPLRPVKATTARLLEHMLGLSIDELLARPGGRSSADDSEAEFRQRLYISRWVDDAMLQTLRNQLDDIRTIDRRLGAFVAREEVRVKISQVAGLLAHCVTSTTLEPLAALLSELYCLAGWQALDEGRITEAWYNYDNARKAATESRLPSYIALATAGQSFVLIDAGETRVAVDVAESARITASQRCSTLLRTWLAAAHGESLAASGLYADSLRSFDTAIDLLPTSNIEGNDPYVALDEVHLARWRGHALARSGRPEAVDVLTESLENLDPAFVRAETALRVDLAVAYRSLGEQSQADEHIDRAGSLASKIGSIRQHRRLRRISSNLT